MREQVGGDHYQQLSPEPLDVMRDWMTESGFRGYLIGNVIKYVARYPLKGGKTDLLKAAHYLDLLLEEATTEGIGYNGSSFVVRSWIGGEAYEAHLRAAVLECVSLYLKDRDEDIWLAEAKNRLKDLIEQVG